MLEMPGELALQKYIKHNYPFAGRKHERFTAGELRMGLAELILQQKAILDTARGKLAFTGSIKHKYLFAERKTPIFRRNLLR